jgi:death on curing protein
MTTLEPWTDWITHETVHNLHNEGIKRYGGKASVSSEKGCVDGALGAAYTAELYSMPEVDSETIIAGLIFCSHLLFYLITKNCFIDGNKRVGWTSCLFVLVRLGLTLDVSDQEAEDYCLAIASGNIRTAADVANWIAERLKSID